MAREISNTDQVLDTRDIEERIDDLKDEEGHLEDAIEAAQEALDDFLSWPEEDQDSAKKLELEQALLDAQTELAAWHESEEGEELKTLEAFRYEVENCTSEWRHGETLIHESYWVEYVEELVKDIGDMPRNIPSYIEIDWKKTADNIKVDYSEVDFDGETYYVRSC